ncbi:hypothetical protein L596_020582 [Steinernema carpocapsae]|uniref:G-protein coupled receptors family 1 profile domain-containing protein n=1 Tax=Steinernema carpocapsae TaxID=34508 RepID=A0A4U5MTY8_STECR|nr:hypothetical protein L596_020582 [Steinernema carpocapsae]
MEMFIFRHEAYLVQYNCSIKTSEEWYKMHQPHITVGVLSIVMGLLYAGLYVFCIVVMAKPELRQNSCYKIMMYLGAIDLVALLFNCIFTGMMFIDGAVFCSYPTIIYITGCIANGLWANQSFTCVLLAINRVLDICDRHWVRCLFAGKRTYIWLVAAASYMVLFAFYTSPVLFSANSGTWMLHAFYKQGVNIDFEVDLRTKVIRLANNATMVVCLVVLYSILSVKLWRSKAKMGIQRRTDCHISRFQKQAVLICLINMITAFTEVVQFVDFPFTVTVIALMIWQASNGAVSLIYLALNRTIRRGVHQMVSNKPMVQEIFKKKMQASAKQHSTMTIMPETPFAL